MSVGRGARRLLAAAALAMAAGAAAGQPLPSEPAADAAAGRMLYRDTPLLRGSVNACVQCHANPAAQRRGATLEDQQDHIRCAIQGGGGGALQAVYPLGAMARFQTKLDGADLRRLATDIRQPDVVAPYPRLQPGRASAGALPLGSIGSTTLELDNLGERPFTVASLALDGRDAGDFSFGAAGCSPGAVIAPGASCPIEVRVAPRCASVREARLVVHHDGPLSPSRVVVQGEGQGPAVPELGVEPAHLALASHGLGSTTAILKVTNRCAGRLVLGSLTLDGPFALATTSGTCAAGDALGPGESRGLAVTRAPGTTGEAVGAVVVAHSASTAPARVAIEAAALRGPALEADPALVSLDGTTEVGATRAVTAAAIRNRGATSAVLVALRSSAADEIDVETTGPGVCAPGAKLAPGASCTLGLTFRPAADGERRGRVEVDYAELPGPGAASAPAPERLSVEVVGRAVIPAGPSGASASGGGAVGLGLLAALVVAGLRLRRRD
jgi:hypothetical protein